MNITIYGMANCIGCLFIKKKLDEEKITYIYIEDYNITLDLCRKHKLKKFPVIEVDEKFMALEDFLKII